MSVLKLYFLLFFKDGDYNQHFTHMPVLVDQGVEE